MNFPKIKLGSQVEKKSRFDLSHDVNTTADFGRVYPLTCVELIPNSSIHFKGNHLCRLSPLSLPSWARVSMRCYARFVSMQEIYEPFENLMSAKSYNNGGASYVPTKVPTISQKALMYWLLASPSNLHLPTAVCSVYSAPTAGSQRLIDREDSSWSTAMGAFKRFFDTSTNVDVYDVFNFGSVVPETADVYRSYNYYVPLDNADLVLHLSGYAFAFRFTDVGRYYRNVLLSLGYQVTFDDIPDPSLLPLFAFFKAYYDLFAPQRYSTWTDTNIYKLMKEIETQNYTSFKISDVRLRTTKLVLFLEDIAGCFYTFNQDFVSAHIDSPAIAPTETIGINSPDELLEETVFTTANHESHLNDADQYSANSVRLIQKLLNFRNIESNIGGRIKEYFRTMFGTDVLHNHESNHIGNYNVNVNISDVMNQAATESAVLGDYAGKGVGYSDHKLSYETRQFGYFICMFAIVPQSNYFQGLAPHLLHTDRFTFYNPSFDSLGYEISNKSAVGCLAECADDWKFDNSFGFIPRYMGYKIHNNVCSGDISLPSMRAQYLGYSLDKFITPDRPLDLKLSSATDKVEYSGSAQPVKTTLPTASEQYRYLNKYPWLGNFDRLFYNYGVSDNLTSLEFHEDNFFLNNVLEIDVIAPMKPASESFTTEAEAGKTIDVVKA